MTKTRDSAVVHAHRRTIRLWLYIVATLVVAMVAVGGATRLTDSGLSIVEWRPVTGTVPPLSQAGWVSEFDKYKTSSEYEIVNKGMTLDEFKRIYWWEWGHRLLGRVIGVVFLLPLLVFHFRGWIEPRLKWPLWIIFGLGGLQGAIGWWMVASGLVGRVDVAQERLAVHLTMAALILVALVWTARRITPARSDIARARTLTLASVAILIGIVVQIALGGLVAGLKAGYIYDTWPLIDGSFIPPRERLLFLEPVWRNLLDNHLTVQFVHRMFAYALVGLALLHALDAGRKADGVTRRGAVVLMLVIVGQAALGVFTLLWNVPVALALAHQLVAMLALILATVHAANLRAAMPAEGRLEGRIVPSERLRAI